MTRTIAWSERVGEVWTSPGGASVEIVGDHPIARLVKLRDADGETEWMPYAQLEGEYALECCGECGMPLSAMRKLLVEEARRNRPAPTPWAPDPPKSTYVKARPGTYCTKPCCWPPHAPSTC